MSREQMVHGAANVLPYHWRVNLPGGDCSCGHVTTLGRQTSEHVARAVLDAILPQVTTVAELVALPVGAVLLDADFVTFDWIGIDREYACLRERHNGHIIHGRVILDDGPLTVVWQPA